jgi:hypothetical protein
MGIRSIALRLCLCLGVTPGFALNAHAQSWVLLGDAGEVGESAPAAVNFSRRTSDILILP